MILWSKASWFLFSVVASTYVTSFCPNRASDEFFSSIFRSIEECLYVIQENQVIIHHHFVPWLAAGAFASIDIRRPTGLLGYCVFSLVYWRIISIGGFPKVSLKSVTARRI